MSKEAAYKIERTQVAGAVDDVSGNPMRLKSDEDTGSLRVNLWVWDVSGLEWVRMIQPQVVFKSLEELMGQLVTEMKVMNTHLATLTGEEIKAEDV
jgi:hypothetical protein